MKLLALIPVLALVACSATNPEKMLVTTSNGITAVTNTTANLVVRDRIDLETGKSIRVIIGEADTILTTAEQNLINCRQNNPKPELGLDPCATNPELKLSQDLLTRLEIYLKAKETK